MFIIFLNREKEAMKIYAITKFAKEMLEIADNLGMYHIYLFLSDDLFLFFFIT